MINLNKRPAPDVHIRAVLPAWLGPGDTECYLEFWARPSGASNTAYAAAFEKLLHDAQVADRKLGRVEGDDAWVTKNTTASTKLTRARFRALYQHCVVNWQTNIQNDGAALETTEASFMGLVDARSKPIASALLALEDRCARAGADEEAVIKDEEKN